MKTFLPILILTGLLNFSLFAKNDVRIGGLMGDVVYTMTSEGMVFKSMKSGEDFDLAIDWTTTNPEMSVYTLDEDYNYNPLGSTRGEVQWHEDKVVFEHIYTNIDLIVHPPVNGQIGYEFVVYPGGDPAEIQLLSDAFKGEGRILASELKAFQDEAGADEDAVEVAFTKESESLKFQVGGYEFAQALTISFKLEMK